MKKYLAFISYRHLPDSNDAALRIRKGLEGYHLPKECEWAGNSVTSGWGSHYDMQLMSCCQHNIIANSTYSWWAAFLNPNPHKIVIMPNHWFNLQLYPEPETALQAKGWVSLD